MHTWPVCVGVCVYVCVILSIYACHVWPGPAFLSFLLLQCSSSHSSAFSKCSHSFMFSSSLSSLSHSTLSQSHLLLLFLVINPSLSLSLLPPEHPLFVLILPRLTLPRPSPSSTPLHVCLGVAACCCVRLHEFTCWCFSAAVFTWSETDLWLQWFGL